MADETSKHVLDPATTYSKDAPYWEMYIKGRPQVPQSFFERVFKYHADHGGKFGTVHEPGAGGGVHSPRLAAKFDKVIITDVSEKNVGVAKDKLLGPQYEYRAAKFEDTIDFPPASVDMIFAAVMFHFTDFDKAFEAAARQLKPGGTFIACLFATPRLEDPKVMEIFTQLMQRGAAQLVPNAPANFGENITANATGYDNITPTEAYFEPGVVRLKLNDPFVDEPGGSWYKIFMADEFKEKYPPISRVSKNDKIISETDEDWAFTRDLDGLKNICHTFNFDSHTPEMEKLWDELAEVMGDREVKGKWLVSCIMATRK